MKILFSHGLPFFLAHGGTQTLIESLMGALAGLGVEVEPERWWDENQRGDIIHFVNRPPSILNVRLAHQKGFRVVMTENLDQTASRSRVKLAAQRALTQTASKLLGGLTHRLAWDVYRELDAMIYVVEHEWETAKYLFNATPSRGHIIPHGLDEPVLTALRERQPEEDYLISVASITERKNTLLLARAAFQAQVPVLFLGRPYAENDPYFKQFQNLIDDRFVRYPGFVSAEEKVRLLRGARGFALISQFESGCIALYEAAAAGLPLFLSDLPWARRVYSHARQVAFARPNSSRLATELSQFYRSAHRLPQPTFDIMSWREVARKYIGVYESVLRSGRPTT